MVKGYINVECLIGVQCIYMIVLYVVGVLISDVQNFVDWVNVLYDGDVLSVEFYVVMIVFMVLNDGLEIDYGYGIGISEIYG